MEKDVEIRITTRVIVTKDDQSTKDRIARDIGNLLSKVKWIYRGTTFIIGVDMFDSTNSNIGFDPNISGHGSQLRKVNLSNLTEVDMEVDHNLYSNRIMRPDHRCDLYVSIIQGDSTFWMWAPKDRSGPVVLQVGPPIKDDRTMIIYASSKPDRAVCAVHPPTGEGHEFTQEELGKIGAGFISQLAKQPDVTAVPLPKFDENAYMAYVSKYPPTKERGH